MTPRWVDGAETYAQLLRVHVWNEMEQLRTAAGGDHQMAKHLTEVCQQLCRSHALSPQPHAGEPTE